jgi:ATP-binding cassette, subfamily B, bacterial
MSEPGPLRRLLKKTEAHRNTVRLAALCSVVNKLFDLAPPALIGAAIDVVVAKQDSLIARLGFETVEQQLWVLALGTLLIWGFESLFEYFYGVLWRNLAQTVQHELRVEAYAHIQDLGLAWFADQSRGGLLSVLNDDVNQLERFLDGGANSLLQVGTTVLAVGASFFLLSPGIAVLAIVPIPLVLWGSFLFQAKIAPRYAEVRQKVGLLNSILSNNLLGIETIKSFTSEAREGSRVEDASQAYRECNRKAIALSSAFSPLIRMAIVIGFVATLVYGGLLALRGELNVGVYSVLVFLTQRLLWPLTRLGHTFDLYQRAMASAARVLDLLDTSVAIVDGKTELKTTDVKGAVRFEELSFGYSERGPLFEGLSLDVPAGSSMGFVGATGAGKSSLVKLLLRFHDVQGGRVSLDGHDVRDLRLADLRGAIGLVSQSVFMFPGTVRENIAYGRPGASEAEIEDAAKLAEAHEFISALPNGYETVVGEQGQKLSGGQRQRISLARAVLKDAPVLILDEATSAVDNETEAAIQRSMRKIAEGRTTLVIAHRLSTIRHADQIVVLEAGRVIEQGRHDELLAKGGVYERLWAVQTGERVDAR